MGYINAEKLIEHLSKIDFPDAEFPNFEGGFASAIDDIKYYVENNIISREEIFFGQDLTENI